MKTRKLSDLAVTIRSKDAGVNMITFDVIFNNVDYYERVKKTGALTRKTVAKLYNLEHERIAHFIEFDVGNAIKFTVYRTVPNGSPGDWDVLGCQHYGPLLNLEIPWD
jgi:hypothetical protein